jgi:hypothetical protein
VAALWTAPRPIGRFVIKPRSLAMLSPQTVLTRGEAIALVSDTPITTPIIHNNRYLRYNPNHAVAGGKRCCYLGNRAEFEPTSKIKPFISCNYFAIVA